MRIWHKSLISVLPKQQLASQWRELLAIKGAIEKKGTPNHILVNKVLDYSIGAFKRYTTLVYTELLNRNYKPSMTKYDEIMSFESDCFTGTELSYTNWHNDIYLRQCLYNLEEKAMCGGIPVEEWQKIVDKFCNKFELWRDNMKSVKVNYQNKEIEIGEYASGGIVTNDNSNKSEVTTLEFVSKDMQDIKVGDKVEQTYDDVFITGKVKSVIVNKEQDLLRYKLEVEID